uniref:Uncharacterized protein n=1 Tax=Ditylum brightwellii TaxID=49249 RepID=A0A7S4RNK6_9STRA
MRDIMRCPLTILSTIVLVAHLRTSDAFSTTKVVSSKASHGLLHQQSSFLSSPPNSISRASPSLPNNVQRMVFLRSLKNEEDGDSETSTTLFDPLGVADNSWETDGRTLRNPISAPDSDSWLPTTAALSTIAALPLILADEAVAKSIQIPQSLSESSFDPDKFRPVCPASDGFYRVLQGTAYTVVGEDNFVEYGPIIASGLLRIRLELCVVESFFNEAVGPFIKQNGLGWVLPLHETVETFLAGTIFALATTFILVGSTKLITVILTYTDVFIGAPCRIFGTFLLDRSKGRPVTLDIGFGRWKKRIVGPPDEKKKKKADDEEDEEQTLIQMFDLEDVNAKNLPFVVASGSLKTAGEASRVSRATFSLSVVQDVALITYGTSLY